MSHVGSSSLQERDANVMAHIVNWRGELRTGLPEEN